MSNNFKRALIWLLWIIGGAIFLIFIMSGWDETTDLALRIMVPIGLGFWYLAEMQTAAIRKIADAASYRAEDLSRRLESMDDRLTAILDRIS